jgi:hypothetical protein
LEPVVTDEEEVVRVLWYPGKVGVTDLRDVETKDVPEDLWRYACDVQQRVSSAFESDDFRIQGQDGVEVDLAAHPGGLNSVRYRKNLEILTHVDSCTCFLFGRQAVHHSEEESWRLMWGPFGNPGQLSAKFASDVTSWRIPTGVLRGILLPRTCVRLEVSAQSTAE